MPNVNQQPQGSVTRKSASEPKTTSAVVAAKKHHAALATSRLRRALPCPTSAVPTLAHRATMAASSAWTAARPASTCQVARARTGQRVRRVNVLRCAAMPRVRTAAFAALALRAVLPVQKAASARARTVPVLKVVTVARARMAALHGRKVAIAVPVRKVAPRAPKAVIALAPKATVLVALVLQAGLALARVRECSVPESRRRLTSARLAVQHRAQAVRAATRMTVPVSAVALEARRSPARPRFVSPRSATRAVAA